ncbi:MAG: permease-like cell division protein FtsX [Eubacteriales bacterium]|nr:permease-like cell division protein FtsX [Eubacteriales bacterium]MDD4717749.1 permease-like cell division protein FtsX [Eubacteriales bacterium]
MRLAAAVHSLKEGIVSIVRHPLASLATVSTITLMLSVMGAFLIFSENAKELAKGVSQQPPILVWAEYDADEDTITAIDLAISGNENVKSYSMQTPEENFEMFREELGENAGVLDGFDPSLLPYTFTVQLEEASLADDFKLELEGVPGVRKVEYSQPVTEFLNSIRLAVNSVTLIAFVILCGVTLFIISNMVRVTVLARGEEIGIMKYVGASNLYIRVPFIIEGSIAGFIGAMAACAVSLGVYSSILNRTAETMNGISFLKLMPVDQISGKVIMINFLLGILIGALGSAISVRKYIKV